MIRLAKFSDDRKYRYWLLRAWDDSKPTAMCIGLNPSTANEETDDRTIKFLIDSLCELGFGSFYMTNLYAFVASKPDVLLDQPDKLGDNDLHLKQIADRCETIIYCWGSWNFVSYRVKRVRLIAMNGKCFGKTKDGSPFHPMAFVRRGAKIDKLINYGNI